MVRTEYQTNTHVYYWETCNHTIWQSITNTFIYRWNKFAWNHTTFNFINKLVACATWFHWFHFNHNVTVLTFTTRLFSVFVFCFNRFTNGFTVSHLRRTHVGFYAKFALHTVNNDFQVQLTHARNNGLTRFFVCTHAE